MIVGRNNHSDESRVQSMRTIRAMSFRDPSHVSGSPEIRSRTVQPLVSRYTD